MKQKYTITIADIEMNVISDESAEAVEALVGIVDRKMREISMMSKRCSKSEAALLCALDYCADSIKGETKTRDMEHEYVQMSRTLENLKKDYEEMAAELEKLRQENAVMSDILSKAATPAAESTEPAPTADVADGEQIALDLPVAEEAAPAAEDTTPPAATEVMFEGEHAEDKPKKTRRSTRSKVTASSKSKVGDMFDMLTFKDV